jgi:hypothetical protein
VLPTYADQPTAIPSSSGTARRLNVEPRRAFWTQARSLREMTSDSLERIDNIINVLDEIIDHMDGFSSASKEL